MKAVIIWSVEKPITKTMLDWDGKGAFYTIQAQCSDGQILFWNRSAGRFMESEYQASHYESARLARVVLTRINLGMEGSL